MAPSSGLWGPIAMRAARQIYQKTTSAIRSRLSLTQQYALVYQPIHPLASLRQSKAHLQRALVRAGNTSVRHYTSSTSHAGLKPSISRAAFSTTRTGASINRLSGRTPFASTLRPNLTGGTLNRCAGGYSLGGPSGARFFSHSPASSAQVIQDVSTAVRAFWTSGQRAQFDGFDKQTGEKRFIAVSALQDKAVRKSHAVPKTALGSAVYFSISPTVTAVSPLATTSKTSSSLADSTFLPDLSADFARAFRDHGIMMSDLKRLQTLGDLPLSMPNPATLKVHFPGVDGGTLERLCDELGVRRGIVREDAGFYDQVGAHMALLFPFVDLDGGSSRKDERGSPHGRSKPLDQPVKPPSPLDWRHMMQASEAGEHSTLEELDFSLGENSPNGTGSPDLEGYESFGDSESEAAEEMYLDPWAGYREIPASSVPAREDVQMYEGVGGLLRFREECDRVLAR
ncbi:MAG: hypothetical protein M1814_002378 [Vezdaea aestivalis]|nr:MAG: hypothetical protein M1814_002378 [Vezdaea aestivalis]